MPPTSLEHDADAPAAARRALDSVAAELSAEKLSDARILVNELVTNSVRHACPGVIELMLDLTPTHLVIAVTDAGAVAVPVDRARTAKTRRCRTAGDCASSRPSASRGASATMRPDAGRCGAKCAGSPLYEPGG